MLKYFIDHPKLLLVRYLVLVGCVRQSAFEHLDSVPVLVGRGVGKWPVLDMPTPKKLERQRHEGIHTPRHGHSGQSLIGHARWFFPCLMIIIKAWQVVWPSCSSSTLCMSGSVALQTDSLRSKQYCESRNARALRFILGKIVVDYLRTLGYHGVSIRQST